MVNATPAGQPGYGEERQDPSRTRSGRLAPSRSPTAWRRWSAVVVLATAGIAMFALAMVLSGGIPEEGDPVIEARAGVLVTAAATTSGAAVTLAAVIMTLGLQREQEHRQRWTVIQREALSEAYDWAEHALSSFGVVVGAMQEWGHAISDDQPAKLVDANRAAQSFYDHDQQLSEVDRLVRMVADRDVVAALSDADGAIRDWNEIAAGDHTTRAVRVEGVQGQHWEVYSVLSEARDQVVGAYATAIREAIELRTLISQVGEVRAVLVP